jgi:hypothetical protein
VQTDEVNKQYKFYYIETSGLPPDEGGVDEEFNSELKSVSFNKSMLFEKF